MFKGKGPSEVKNELDITSSHLDSLMQEAQKQAQDLSARLASREFDIVENNLRRFMESLSDGAFFINENYSIYHMNHAAEQIVGVENEDFVEISIFDLFPKSLNHEMQLELSDKLTCSRYEFERDGVCKKCVEEFQMLNLKEEIIPVTISVSVQKRSDDSIYYMMIIKDLTPWKEQSRHLEALKKAFMYSRDKIMIMTTDGEITYHNNAFFTYYFQDIEEINTVRLHGKNFFDLKRYTPTLDKTITSEAIDQVLQGDVWRTPIEVYNEDKNLVKTDITLLPILNGVRSGPYYIMFYQLGLDSADNAELQRNN